MKRFIAFLLPLAFTLQAFAVTPADVAYQQQLIQRRQLQDAQDLQRQRELDQLKNAREKEAAPVTDQQTPQDIKGGCLKVKQLKISGNKKLGQKIIAKTARPYLKECMDAAQMQELQSAIQKLYVKKGYITARIYFNFNEASNGVLGIIISEGKINKFYLTPCKDCPVKEGARAKTRLFSAFPLKESKTLNLRDIEQGIEQINKLSSNNAVMEVRPADDYGFSDIYIINNPQGKTQLGLNYDNSGQDSTGRYKGRLSLAQDDILAFNENLYASYTTSLGVNRDKKYSDLLSAAFFVPLGRFTLSDNFSYSKYLATVKGDVQDFTTDGYSYNNDISLDYLISRGQKYKLYAGLQLGVYETKNYIADTYISSSSRLLAAGAAYVNYVYYGQLSSLFTRLSLKRGLPVFGAEDDKNKPAGFSEAEFTSLNFNGDYYRFFGPLTYSLSLTAQYSADNLYSSQQLLIGGESSVRGFRDISLFGDSGLYARNEVKLPFYAFLHSQNPYINSALGYLYAAAFIDYGYVRQSLLNYDGSLAGAGAKIGLSSKYLYGGITYARALYAPKGVDKEGSIFYFNLGFNIAFF